MMGSGQPGNEAWEKASRELTRRFGPLVLDVQLESGDATRRLAEVLQSWVESERGGWLARARKRREIVGKVKEFAGTLPPIDITPSEIASGSAQRTLVVGGKPRKDCPMCEGKREPWLPPGLEYLRVKGWEEVLEAEPTFGEHIPAWQLARMYAKRQCPECTRELFLRIPKRARRGWLVIARPLGEQDEICMRIKSIFDPPAVPPDAAPRYTTWDSDLLSPAAHAVSALVKAFRDAFRDSSR